MGFGLDISAGMSMLVGLSGARGSCRLKAAVALPGLEIDPGEQPEACAGSRFGSTWRSLKNLGIKPGSPVASIPGRDIFFRMAPCGHDENAINAMVRLEADDVAGEGGTVLGDYQLGVAPDYSPVAHIGLAREAVVDHYANSLRAAGVQPGLIVPGCIALFNAYLLCGDISSEKVTAYANIGESASDVVLVREGSLLYARTFNSGVADFIERLAPEYGDNRENLRRLLFTELSLKPGVAADNVAGDRGVEAGQQVADALIQQISGTIAIARGAHRERNLDAPRIVISGPGAAIPGLRELMMARLRKTVEVFNPFAEVDLSSADAASREAAESYGTALTLAVGLAAISISSKAEVLNFRPASIRRRQEFLQKSLFLYLAALVVIAVSVPGFLLSTTAAGDAEKSLEQLRNGPLGRYTNASGQMPVRKAGLQRAEKRAEAAESAALRGVSATELLTGFAKVRPDAVYLRGVEMKPARQSSDKTPAKNEIVLELFIERLPGVDPSAVKNRLRDILKSLPVVAGVTPGTAAEVADPPGMDVSFTIELKEREGEVK